jgi:hypothetical protein
MGDIFEGIPVLFGIGTLDERGGLLRRRRLGPHDQVSRFAVL